MINGTPVPTIVIVRPDRSFHFEIRTPPTAHLLLNAAGVKERKGKVRGAMQPGRESVGEVSLKHIYEIAKIKATDEHMKHLKLESIARTVVGTARTLGVQVVP